MDIKTFGDIFYVCGYCDPHHFNVVILVEKEEDVQSVVNQLQEIYKWVVIMNRDEFEKAMESGAYVGN